MNSIWKQRETIHMAARFLVLVVAAIIILGGCLSQLPSGSILGSGRMATQTYDFSRFDSVEISDTFQADITAGDGYAVEVTVDDNLVDYRWRSTRTDAGLAHKLHDLRHYFASDLIAAGCDVVTVQRAMGHASATTTLSTYAHLWPTAEDKTRAAAAAMAAEVLASKQPPRSSVQTAD